VFFAVVLHLSPPFVDEAFLILYIIFNEQLIKKIPKAKFPP
jgi:hypothetical protein